MTAFAKKMEKENCAGKLKASTSNSEKTETERKREGGKQTDRDLKAPPEAAKQTNRRTGRRRDWETDCGSDGD